MSGAVCDVCGQPSVGVACSALGAVSFAYCEACAGQLAEPYGVLVSTVAMVGGIDDVAPWVEPVIRGTLARTGKTFAQFVDDVATELAAVDAEGR